MILVVCATELELQPLLDRVISNEKKWMSLICGVGVVEASLSLGKFLTTQSTRFDAVLHFGVAGAYLAKQEGKAHLLDICLAEKEVFGDFGICYANRFESLPENLAGKSSYLLDAALLEKCHVMLTKENIQWQQGTFVTVAGVSATEQRGNMLAKQYDALCENMEGAAVAMACGDFDLPLIEIRCISNFVENRDCTRWKLQEACEKAGEITAILLRELMQR